MKSKLILPAIFVAVFALSRIPGLMPLNFSVAYAFAFCAGVFFRGPMRWWLPLGVMLVTDIGLNCYYQSQGVSVWSAAGLAKLAVNYLAYALLILLGRAFSPRSSWFGLLGGGLLGAVLFYLITNTVSWLQDPAYVKTIAGWIQALTTGRPDWHPTTWEMFRNTLLSGGLFTALFGALGKLTAESPAEKNAGAREPAAEGEAEAEPEEAKA